MKIEVNQVTTAKEIEQCLDIRVKVFVEGQNVPMEEEIDGKDKDSEHYLLRLDNKPAGVARVRFINGYAKIERVGVLNNFQGQGLGKKIMEKILADLDEKRVSTAKLSSQCHAIPFYEKLGFIVSSEEYLDANIPHKDMILILNHA